MAQQFWKLPGRIQHFLSPKYCLVSAVMSAYSGTSYDLFSRAGPGVEIPSESQKQEAHPSNLGPRARKEYVASDTTADYVPIMSVVFTVARHFL